MLWMMPAWVAWCWSGTGDDLHQDDDADKVVLVRTTMWWMTAPRMTWWTTAAWVALCRDLKQPKAYGNLAVNRTFETAR